MRLSLLFLAVVCVGCSESEADKPIWVGHVHGSSPTDESFNALSLAVETLNRHPDRLPQGRRLQVRHAPGGARPEEWGAQAARLIVLNRVHGLVCGGTGADAERIGASVQGEGVIALSTAGWSDGPTPNLFTVGLCPAERGRVLARAVPRAKAVLIVRDPAARAAGAAADRFAHEMRAAGAVVTEKEPAELAGEQADVVFFACPARVAVRHRPAAGTLLFGDGEAELAVLASLGPSADGFLAATAYHPVVTADGLRPFIDQYQQQFGRPPTAEAVLAHDALTIWVEAARRVAGFAADDLRRALLQRDQSFASLTGPLTFAADHTARRPAIVGTMSGGKLVDVKPYDPEPAP